MERTEYLIYVIAVMMASYFYDGILFFAWLALIIIVWFGTGRLGDKDK